MYSVPVYTYTSVVYPASYMQYCGLTAKFILTDCLET